MSVHILFLKKRYFLTAASLRTWEQKEERPCTASDGFVKRAKREIARCQKRLCVLYVSGKVEEIWEGRKKEGRRKEGKIQPPSHERTKGATDLLLSFLPPTSVALLVL